MGTAPIAVFMFNRADHLQRTLESLRRCEGFEDSPVYVFGDGPKGPHQEAAVAAARAVAQTMLGGRAQMRFAERNKGLARSIIDGVGALTAEHGRAIVVEDDLDLAPGFLGYVNAALDRYAEAENVYQVSGHAFDAPELAGRRMAALLPFTTTWGWATWDRAWASFDEAANGSDLLRTDVALRRRFDLDGVYSYSAMMERQKQGRVDSWGIRWYWIVFRAGGLAVYPPQSLVRNTGMDGSGSHGRGVMRRFGSTDAEWPAAELDFPAPVLDQQAYAAVRRAIWRQNGGLLGRTVDILKRRLKT
jgi:hypothetical protein